MAAIEYTEINKIAKTYVNDLGVKSYIFHYVESKFRTMYLLTSFLVL